MKEKQILVIIKEPGKAPVVEPLFENDLKAVQEAVGGYIETVTLATDLVIICNEEGRLQGLPWNCTAFGVDFCGTIIAAGIKGEEFASLPARAVPAVLRVLGGLSMKTGELVHHLRVLDCEQCYLCRECKDPHKLKCFLFGDAADMLEAQQKRIKELEAERRWIPVTERLPDVHKPVLVCREKEPGVLIVEQGCKDLGDWWRVYGTRVKRIRFWMPLPKPPGES